MKKLILLTATLSTFILSCSGPTKEEYDKVKKELSNCKKTVENLENTPQNRLLKAENYLTKEEYSKSKNEFLDLIEKYPGTSEAKTSDSKIAEIETFLKKKKEDAERKKTLGFKALKENTKIKVGDVSLSFSNTSLSGRWIFDNYGDEYRYRDAERGTKFLISKISISADSKNPNLPPLLVYGMRNGVLNLLGTLEYRFVRWEDYASYLGNNADYGNDFAHTKTIRFSAGLQVSNNETSDKTVFLVMKKVNCFSRSTDRFGNPPVSYIGQDCGAKQQLGIDDFEKEYEVVKVFNQNKL